MILQALVEYYEALERKEKITSPGWCRARVAYGLDISEQGELMGVIPLKKEQQNGKKTVWVPQDLTVPQMVSRSSGVSANFLCDHSGYMLGIDNKGKPERSRECFECAKKKHKDILGNISSPAARAVSYTHLDVYKRQIQGFADHGCKRLFIRREADSR